MLWVAIFVVGKVLQTTTVGPHDVPLGTWLLAGHGAPGYFLMTAGAWLLLASAMHAGRWYVRLQRVLPGGVANPDALRTDPDAVAFARAFFEAGKPVAAICHAPRTLVEADVVR